MTTSTLFNDMKRASAANDPQAVVALGPRCLGEMATDLSLLPLQADARAIYGHALNELEQLPEAITQIEEALYGSMTHHLRVFKRSALTMLLANSYWKVGRYDDVIAAVAPVLNGQGTPARWAPVPHPLERRLAPHGQPGRSHGVARAGCRRRRTHRWAVVARRGLPGPVPHGAGAARRSAGRPAPRCRARAPRR